MKRAWQNVTRSMDQRVLRSNSVQKKRAKSKGGRDDTVRNSDSSAHSDRAASAQAAYCAHHIPSDNSYWAEADDPPGGYIKCKYSDDCQRVITHADRVNSLRRALHGTAALFRQLGVEHMLYGGSAIGQYRCGDVLPWDVDC